MAERSKLTREHLVAGYSRLNRAQLIEALRRVVPKLVEGEGEAAAKPARGAGKRVTATDVEREADQLREASLRKKVDTRKTEPGARPVTARRVEKKAAEKGKDKPLSRGVARVKSAIATIAKEVEARRRAAKPAEKKPKVEAPRVEAPKVEAPKVEAPKVEARKPEPAPAPEAPAKPEAPAAREAPTAAEQPQPAEPAPAPRERPKVVARSTIERAREVMAAWLRTEREIRAQRADAEGQGDEAARPFPAEPVVEGFFVARVVGRGEARRHH